MFQWKLAAILFLFGLNNSFAVQGVIDQGQEINATNSDFYNNTLINNGLILSIHADGAYDNPPSTTLINNRNILLKNDDSIIRNVAIHNKPSWTIVLMNKYLEGYPTTLTKYYPSQIINEGNILIPEKNIVDTSCTWTGSFQGEIINKPTGRLIATRDTTKCSGDNIVGDGPDIQNSGYFEIGPKTTWDSTISGSGDKLRQLGNYSQTGGELHVDGLLAAKNFGFSGGKLSGNGTIKGKFPGDIKNTIIYPGGPDSVGTLKIHSTETTKTLVFVSDIDIDIKGVNNYDKLVITAPVVDFANTAFNIKISPNFLPPNTATFDIIQVSNSIYPDFDIRLPDLSYLGVQLDIQQVGNNIKLIMTRI